MSGICEQDTNQQCIVQLNFVLVLFLTFGRVIPFHASKTASPFLSMSTVTRGSPLWRPGRLWITRLQLAAPGTLVDQTQAGQCWSIKPWWLCKESQLGATLCVPPIQVPIRLNPSAIITLSASRHLGARLNQTGDKEWGQAPHCTVSTNPPETFHFTLAFWSHVMKVQTKASLH